jgi:hypothetical protein
MHVSLRACAIENRWLSNYTEVIVSPYGLCVRESCAQAMFCVLHQHGQCVQINYTEVIVSPYGLCVRESCAQAMFCVLHQHGLCVQRNECLCLTHLVYANLC